MRVLSLSANKTCTYRMAYVSRLTHFLPVDILTLVIEKTLDNVQLLRVLIGVKKMMKRKRLLPEERKKEIRKAAARIFKEKGFSATTMEDVIAESELSTGGVYHYYKNTVDILYDLMEEGNQYRINETVQHIQHGSYTSSQDMAAQFIADKILDENEYKPLYALFLLEKAHNPKLQELYTRLKTEGLQKMRDAFAVDQTVDGSGYLDNFLFVFTSALTIGFECLQEKEILQANREALVAMVKAYLEYCLKI